MSEVLKVRIPEHLKANLEKYARSKGVTMSTVVRTALSYFLNSEDMGGKLDVVERIEEKKVRLAEAEEMYHALRHVEVIILWSG